jgi:hypothetical protein
MLQFRPAPRWVAAPPSPAHRLGPIPVCLWALVALLGTTACGPKWGIGDDAGADGADTGGAAATDSGTTGGTTTGTTAGDDSAIDGSDQTSAGFEAATGATPYAAAPASLQRLTRIQYANAIRDVLGDSIVIPAQIEPDVAIGGFLAVGASKTTISPRGIEQYQQAAYNIAAQVMADPALKARIVGCDTSAAGQEACARDVLKTIGRKLWRRTLWPDELDRLVAIFAESKTALGGFDKGMEFALAALLQSPNFLYRVELGEGVDGGTRRYTSAEMATRLAFYLWNTTPDEELLAAGERGELVTSAGIKAQVERLLKHPRARAAMRNFFTEYFELYKLDDLSKDPKIFTYASADLGPDAREETLRGLEYLIFDQDGDYREIFTTRRTFINRRLAAIYDVPAPQGDGFAATLLPVESPRRGILGQASFLALQAHAVASSATLRGKFVRTALLCGEIPPPPANVSTALPEGDKNQPTLRDRIKIHLEVQSCANCHLLMDPIGWGFEQFDGIGRFRTKENDATIDPSGDVDGVPYADAAAIGALIASSPAMPRCFVRNLYRYATGEVETSPDEEALISTLAIRFREGGFNVKSLLRDIAISRAMRRAGELAAVAETPADTSAPDASDATTP